MNASQAAKILLMLGFLFAFSACSGKVNPLVPSGESSIESSGVNDDSIGILGAYEMVMDTQNVTAELTPKRSSDLGQSYLVSGNGFFMTSPCRDCFEIRSMGIDGDGNIIVGFKVRHPFPKGDVTKPPSGRNRLDLDIFDLALVIVPVPEDINASYYEFIDVGIWRKTIGNASGYTSELGKYIQDIRVMPYILVVDDSKSIPPVSTFNRLEMGASKEFEAIFIRPERRIWKFDLYLMFGYGNSAVLSTRLEPKYYNPEFNQKAAWKIEAEPPNGSNPPQYNNTWGSEDNITPHNVTVKVYDWQIGAHVDQNLHLPTDVKAPSNIKSVAVEIPGMNNSLQEVDGASYEPGGTGSPDNPLVYKIPIINENYIPGGVYDGLVRVEDERAPLSPSYGSDYLVQTSDGIHLNTYLISKYVTYQTFKATVLGPSEFNPVDVTPDWLNFAPNDICIDGNYAYTTGYHVGLHIFDVSDPYNPTWVNWIDTAPYRINGCCVENGHAYLAGMDKKLWESALLIADVDPPQDAHIEKIMLIGYEANDVQVSGEYAYVTGWTGLVVVDISPPENAQVVKTVDDTNRGSEIYISGDYAFVGFGNELKIIDISSPRDAFVLTCVELDTIDSIFVYQNYAYVVGNYQNYGLEGSLLEIVDIDPINESHVVKTFEIQDFSYDIQVINGLAYIAANESGMMIIDVDPYYETHIVNNVFVSGGQFSGLSIEGEYAFVADKSLGLHVIDIEPYNEAQIISGISSTGRTQGVHISGDYAFLAEGPVGLKILDINPPEQAHLVKIVNTPDWAEDVFVSNGYAYVADRELGIQVIDVDPLGDAHIVKTVEYTGDVDIVDIFVEGNYAYAAYMEDGLQIIDITDPPNASIIKSVSIPGFNRETNSIVVSGGYAYVTVGNSPDDSFVVIDVDPVMDSHIATSIGYGNYCSGVCVSGDFAYFNSSGRLHIVDINPPEEANIVKMIDLPERHCQFVSDGFCYLVGWGGGLNLEIVNVEPPENAHLSYIVEFPFDWSDMGYGRSCISGNYIYSACDFAGLRIIKLW